MFVQRSVTSVVDGISNRSASSGCSPLIWSTTFWITAPSWAEGRPLVSRTLVRSGVVEVDDEADAPAGHPHADPDAVVLRVHQVHVVAAIGRLLVLEEEVRAEDRRPGATGAAADVLGPGVVRVAGRAQTVARIAADEVAAVVADREPLGIRPRHLRADAAVEPERRDVATARAAARPARGHPAAGPRAVHEAQVVRLDRRPRATADRTAASAASAASAATTAGAATGVGLRDGGLGRDRLRNRSEGALRDRAERGAVTALGRGRDRDHDP